MRNSKWWRSAVACGALVVLAACGGGSSSTYELPSGEKWQPESGSDVVVDARDNIFVPQFIEVKKGTTVTWENTGRNRHNVLADDEGDFDDEEELEDEEGDTDQIGDPEPARDADQVDGSAEATPVDNAEAADDSLKSEDDTEEDSDR